jgi:hypothetical protein
LGCLGFIDHAVDKVCGVQTSIVELRIDYQLHICYVAPVDLEPLKEDYLHMAVQNKSRNEGEKSKVTTFGCIQPETWPAFTYATACNGRVNKPLVTWLG